MYSALRWRLFLQGGTQEIGSLPFDVLVYGDSDIDWGVTGGDYRVDGYFGKCE